MRENCLKWFGHVYKRPKYAVRRKSDGVHRAIKEKEVDQKKLG